MSTKAATSATPKPAIAPSGGPSRQPPGRRRRDAWWKTSLRLLLVTLLAGVIPILLAGQILHIWQLSLPTRFLPGFLAPAAPTHAPAFSPPRDLWIASGADVLPRAGDGAPVARLEAGFPVRLTEWGWRGSAAWGHVIWVGPTRASGGTGWIAESTLTSFAAHTHPLGDLGALAPPLRQAADAGHIAAAFYFPDSGQLYLSPAADQPIALGSGLRGVLLGDLFATAELRGEPLATTPGSLADQLVRGDPGAFDTTYTQLGDAAGVAAYLGRLGIADGFQLKPGQASQASATPRALVRFYTVLAATNTLSAADRQALFELLTRAAQADGSASVAPAALIGPQGALVVANVSAGSSRVASAAGVLAPSGGPRAIVAASASADSAPAASGALTTWYAQVATTFA